MNAKSSLRAAALLLLITAPVRAKLIIVALGDSMTAGKPYFLSPLESPPDGSGDVEAPYTHWMSLRQPDWEIINAGISGQRTDEILNRTEQALATASVPLGRTRTDKPRYLIVLAGANDIAQQVPLNLTAKNLLAIYKKAKAATVIPVAATIPPINVFSPEQAKQLDELNQWIIKASDHLRIPLADLNRALRDPSAPQRSLFSEDGIHPDHGGYRKIGSLLAEIIAGMEAALHR